MYWELTNIDVIIVSGKTPQKNSLVRFTTSTKGNEASRYKVYFGCLNFFSRTKDCMAPCQLSAKLIIPPNVKPAIYKSEHTE